MWILEPIQFRVADSKKPIFENLTKEKSRVLFFRDQPKFIGMSDWPQFFFKMTMMDIGSKSVINRTWSKFKMGTIYVFAQRGVYHTPPGLDRVNINKSNLNIHMKITHEVVNVFNWKWDFSFSNEVHIITLFLKYICILSMM